MEPPQQPSPIASVCGGDPPLAGLRLLVVDDDPNTREMLCEALMFYGAEVDSAGSSGEALERVRAWRPSLVLSDVGMPEGDGFDFIRRLRSLPAGEGGALPAIALTGYARPEDRERLLALGYQLFLAKPVELDQLVREIGQLGVPGSSRRP